MSTTKPFEIRVGDTLVVLTAELFRLNTSGVETAANLTGKTVTFSMRNAATGTLVVDAAAATITDATTGQVEYDFDPSEVTTAGIYWYTFKEIDATEPGSFPVNPTRGVMWIHGDTQTAQDVYAAAMAGE
jgi:hypothetical protein